MMKKSPSIRQFTTEKSMAFGAMLVELLVSSATCAAVSYPVKVEHAERQPMMATYAAELNPLPLLKFINTFDAELK
jgi:hypothetical protein